MAETSASVEALVNNSNAAPFEEKPSILEERAVASSVTSAVVKSVTVFETLKERLRLSVISCI